MSRISMPPQTKPCSRAPSVMIQSSSERREEQTLPLSGSQQCKVLQLQEFQKKTVIYWPTAYEQVVQLSI
jgi:hypothetical protein